MQKITRAVCKRIAFCKRGKNGLRTILKSEGGEPGFEIQPLVKADMSQGRLLTVVAAPEMLDSDGQAFGSIEVVEDMAHGFVGAGGLELDIEHDGAVLDKSAARLIESFMIQPTDSRFEAWETYNGETVNLCKSGGWATEYQIDDPELRAAYERGDWDGVSLFGLAAVEQLDLKAASQRVAERLGQENNMTPAELEAVLKAQATQTVDLVKSAIEPLVAAIKPAPKTTETEGDKQVVEKSEGEARPVFTGMANDAEALGAYAVELNTWELNQKLSKGEITAEQLTAMVKSMGETDPSDEEAGIQEGDTDEVKGLRRKLFKAEKNGSNAGTVESPTGDIVEMSKAEKDEMVALIESNLGGKPVNDGSFQLVPRS